MEGRLHHHCEQPCNCPLALTPPDKGSHVQSIEGTIAGISDGNEVIVQLSSSSFEAGGETQAKRRASCVPGSLVLFPSIEAFKAANKEDILREHLNAWQSAGNGAFPFVMLVYADVKRHKFAHWTGFPAPKPRRAHTSDSGDKSADVTALLHDDAMPGRLPWAVLLAAWQHRRLGQPDPAQPSATLMVHSTSKTGDCEASREVQVWFDSPPAVTGWSRNARGKLGPRVTDLSQSMSGAALVREAAHLNLNLMRWRAAPSLRLEALRESKCLLIGAGTLGCHLARLLQGWGVGRVTFLDSGTVSYSNPTRQPLFEVADAEHKSSKALTAAAALRRVAPTLACSGIRCSVPMPGHHSAAAAAAVKQDVQTVKQAILEHDVVFLLTDTRESRWLPSLLCAAHRVPAINVALGFDTCLVMRHGSFPEPVGGSGVAASPAHDLGCYFCADIVAPGDSTKDRTLDQQCTVTRPGLAAWAAAMAVELWVNVMNHPDGWEAPPDTPADATAPHASPLGCTPHTLRAFLSHFMPLPLVTHAFPHCPACGVGVRTAYAEGGDAWLVQALTTPGLVEESSGLAQYHAEAAAAMQELDWDEEGDDF